VETLTPFHRSLAANRGRLNAKFALARQAYPALNGAAFLAHLDETVGPIVAAVAAAQPAAVDAVLDALFDLSLELMGEGVLERPATGDQGIGDRGRSNGGEVGLRRPDPADEGRLRDGCSGFEPPGPEARRAAVAEGWRTLLPALPGHLAVAPRRVAVALTNALYNLAGTPGGRPADWLATLRDVGPECPDVATLLKIGQVAAWLAGLAHYRGAGLALCRELAPALVGRVLNLTPRPPLLAGEGEVTAPPPSQGGGWGVGALLDRLAADPWLLPQAAGLPRPAWTPALKLAARVGAFRGFGGDFLAPPAVTWAGGQFYVQDGETWWLLSADVFGATLLRVDAPIKPSGRSPDAPFQVSQAAEIVCGPHRAAFPELTAVKSWAADAKTLAVTSPLSHAVFLFAVM
jgi:hypothetical protein